MRDQERAGRRVAPISTRNQDVSVGGDLKYRLASNLLLNATVNPDFGQVEADPSELNLSAFETFFTERRPFFVEGKGLFTFTVNCVVVVDCNTGEGLFYSRRIGRSPQLADVYGDAIVRRPPPRSCGAAKVTGRLPGRLLARRARRRDRSRGRPGRHDARARDELRASCAATRTSATATGSVGFIVTGVNRVARCLERAYCTAAPTPAAWTRAGGSSGRYEVSGSLDLSRVAGDPAAIALTQQDPVHLYQRPDGPLTFDPTRTSLERHQRRRCASPRSGGKRLHFETAYQRRSPGFEINDIGFLRQADQQEWTSWANLVFNQPNRIFQQLRWNFNNWEYWTAAGLPTERAFNTNVHIQFTNRWWLHTGRHARPARRHLLRPLRAGRAGDTAGSLHLALDHHRGRRPAAAGADPVGQLLPGATRVARETIDLSPELDLKVSSRFTTSLSVGIHPQPERRAVLRHVHRRRPAGSTTPSPISSRRR